MHGPSDVARALVQKPSLPRFLCKDPLLDDGQMPRPDLDPELAVIETLLPPQPTLDPETFHLQIRGATRLAPDPGMPERAGIEISDETHGEVVVRIVRP